MKIRRCFPLILFFLIVVGFMDGCSKKENIYNLSGTIHFDDGENLEFVDMTSLIFILKEEAEAIPQNVTEWPIFFDQNSISRSIPLSWIKSIEIVSFTTKDQFRCLFNPVVDIESVTGVHIFSEYKTLEWVKVKIHNEKRKKDEFRHVYFADSGEYLKSMEKSRINIRKIVFNN